MTAEIVRNSEAQIVSKSYLILFQLYRMIVARFHYQRKAFGPCFSFII